ncbi:GerAB/ArcD/ProY family transporter [Sporosarcina sp. UB5]|uniref:GerAB/ArcD/ProY family transporter n=1 Tax=Sporosarcina sp. UB5 TaxID=3047463 RepID=UPI003D7AFCFE
MNRFLLYLILINMLTNMVSITPRILITGMEKGAIPSMVIAIVVGIALSYFIIILFSYFPGQGLPEILNTYTPKWIAKPVLLFLSLTWFFAGLITLSIYVYIILHFLTPTMSYLTIVLAFVLVVTYGVFMTAKNILYMSEIIFVLFVPLIAFVQLKGYLSPNLHWDYVRIAVMQVNHLPHLESFSASLFIVAGTASLAIFNRFFKKIKKPTGKGIALLTILTTYILATTFFLPIGFGGFESLENVLYPWVMTSDSIRMKYGIIERIVFIFIGAFLALSVVTLIMHWHLSIQLLLGAVYFKKFKWKKRNLTLPLFIVIYWAASIYSLRKITSPGLFDFVKIFDTYVFPVVLLATIGSLLLAKKGAASKWQANKKG